MADKIETTEKTKSLMPTLGENLQALAFKQADEFISAGQTVREATSIVASLLIDAAWVVAGCGAVSDGVTPDQDKFRGVVEATFQNITFKDPSTKAGGRS